MDLTRLNSLLLIIIIIMAVSRQSRHIMPRSGCEQFVRTVVRTCEQVELR